VKIEPDRRWDHIGREVLRVHRDFQARALAELRSRGHTSLTPSQIGLLPHLESDGTTVSTAARRAEITKQAVGKLVHELERHGYVKRTPDRLDARAAVVTFTDAGAELLSDIGAVIESIESAYVERIGERRFRQLRTLLAQLA
jgi:DNA-binding MarR family transcriptional regulator